MAMRPETNTSSVVPIIRGKTDATPAEVKYDPRKLEVLEDYFRRLVGEGKIQCASYLLARRGEIFASAAMGKLDYRNGGQFSLDSIRLIGSITKMVTALAVFQLWERGLFDPGKPVAGIIKEFDTSLHRGINAYHLLSHTSGLRADGGYFLEPYPFAPNAHSDNWIRSILEGPLQSEPGQVWSYCSAGYGILGEIISRIAGQSYADYVAENILAPLKMNDTCFKVPAEKAGRVCFTRDVEIEWLKEWASPESPYPPSGYHLLSTLPDLYRLGHCLAQNGELDGYRLLGRKSIEYMRRNQLHNVPAFHWGKKLTKFRYGMGVALTGDGIGTPAAFGHDGYGASSLFIDPDHGLVSVFFVPTAQGTLIEAVDNPRAIIWSGLL